MDASWLESFKGQHCTVLTITENERSDTGTLVRVADGWLQMIKDNGEMILIPWSAIRQVKMLDMTQTVPSLDRRTLPPLDTHIYEPNAQTL